jgi:hypothetical protein
MLITLHQHPQNVKFHFIKKNGFLYLTPIKKSSKLNGNMIYDSVTDILKCYPQRNMVWQPLDSMFIADASDFGGLPIKDPWNRPFPNQSGVIDAKYDAEGDIIYWNYKTTVDGEEVVCKIFND